MSTKSASKDASGSPRACRRVTLGRAVLLARGRCALSTHSPTPPSDSTATPPSANLGARLLRLALQLLRLLLVLRRSLGPERRRLLRVVGRPRCAGKPGSAATDHHTAHEEDGEHRDRLAQRH